MAVAPCGLAPPPCRRRSAPHHPAVHRPTPSRPPRRQHIC